MKNKRNINALNLILLVILSLVFITTTAQAQSTSQASPTALTAEFSGKGPSKETIYYFNFTGGAGEVSVALDIKAKQYSTFARLELLDAELNTLATHNMNAATTTGNAQVLKKITLGEKQTVLLKLTLDANLAEYKITLGGAVELASTSTENNSNTTTESNSSTETQQDSVSQSTGGTTIQGTNKDKIFNIDLGKFKLGQFINLPKSGTLIIQMKDGTTQEIDLKTVKNVTVKP